VRIIHADGIATIPLQKLSKEQIRFLNTTSSLAQIDPDWAEKRRLAEEAKAKRIEEEAKKAMTIAVAKRSEALAEAKHLEDAARYDEAMSKYVDAQSAEDVKRLAGTMASDFEAKKDYESAADYFEKAGLFSEAGRIRKSYNMSESISTTRLSSEEIFRRCAPATVSIVTTERDGVAVGSGFFVRRGGYILTNHHVVESARTISVLIDKEIYPAEVLAQSATPDLALIKISLADHPILELSDSDQVKAGAQVFAIGTPKGLPKSITGGMVSSTDRVKYGNKVFQISALINHGNSGGPLINAGGKVIGIATFGEGTAAVVDGVSIGSDVQGINYAIKANEAKRLLSRLPK
jgi:S1-C subfamily serine protease